VIGAFAFVNECAKWLPGLTVSKQLASLSIFHKIIYFQTPGVWPIKPRYMSVEVRGEHLGQRGAATRRWGHARGSTRCRMRPDRVLRAGRGSSVRWRLRGSVRASRLAHTVSGDRALGPSSARLDVRAVGARLPSPRVHLGETTHYR